MQLSSVPYGISFVDLHRRNPCPNRFRGFSSDTDFWVFYLVVRIVFLVQLLHPVLSLFFAGQCRRKSRNDRFRGRFLRSCFRFLFFCPSSSDFPCVDFLRGPMPTRFPSRANADAIKYRLTLLETAAGEFISSLVRLPNLLVPRTRISLFSVLTCSNAAVLRVRELSASSFAVSSAF